MGQPKALLDTDTLSAVMKGNPLVLARAREYLGEHGAFDLSIITRYEILRRRSRHSTGSAKAAASFP